MPTVVTAGVAAALFSLGVVLLGAAGQVSAQHEAQVAADLAAVAGAFAVYRGEDGCTAAATVAEDNGASLIDCRGAGADLTVTAKIRGREVTSTAGPA